MVDGRWLTGSGDTVSGTRSWWSREGYELFSSEAIDRLKIDIFKRHRHQLLRSSHELRRLTEHFSCGGQSDARFDG